VSEQPEQQRSLYRRHRPRTFADVVGQEAVVRTLRNAVQRGRVHHAYLFVGSRGTGKTSMAKILAACLNCERGPTIEPCGQCESCRRIMAATSLDVIEMDAASNNSVEDIRELRESVAYAPVSGRKKVYILDEAHMLSGAAWNAFLKTLEEPPPDTVFVLATTEANKVPATVVDRCHRFDFARPSIEQLASVVRRVATAESIELPPEAAAAVARAATGSFRDALGTLEQLVTYSGATIAAPDVLAVLGVADGTLLEEIVDAVAAGDAPAVLRAVATCAQQGRDASALSGDLETRARELLIANTLEEVPAELRLTPELDERLLAQARRTDAATLVRLLELLGSALEATKAGADPRTQLEVALVKAAKPEVDASRQALLVRIERLEGSARRSLEGGVGRVSPTRRAPGETPAEPRNGAGPLAADRAVAAEAKVPSGVTRASAAEAPAPESAPPPGAAAEAPGIPAAEAAAPAAERATAPAVDSAPSSAPTADLAPAETPAPEPAHAAHAPASDLAPAETPALEPPHSAPAPASDLAPAETPAPEPAHAAHAPASDLAPAEAPAPESLHAAPSPSPIPTPDPASAGSVESLQALWPSVVEAIMKPNALLGSVIAGAQPVELDGDELTVAFDSSSPFMKKKAEDADNRMAVATVLRELTGRRLRLSYELRELESVPGAIYTEEEWVARFMTELDAEELAGQPAGASTSEKG
jgi:DNA polymerase-3 subunit gamma/tau